MNFFERTSVKIRFLILILVIILFTVASALTFLHTVHSIAAPEEIKKEVDNYFTEIHAIGHQLDAFAISLSGSTGGATAQQQEIFALCDDFLDEIHQLKNNKLVGSEDSINHYLETITSHITELKSEVATLAAGDRPQDPVATITLLHHRFIDPILKARAGIRDAIYIASFRQQKRDTQNLVFVLFVSIIVIIFLVTLSEISNYRNIQRLLKFSVDLDRGNRKARIRLSSGSEFMKISQKLNSFLDKQSEKIRFLRTIGEEGEQSGFEPESTDILGNEINIMAHRLRKSQQEEEKRHEEDKRRNWISEGIAQFSELLRSEPGNVKELAYLVIQKMVTYMDIEMGTLFLTMKDENGEPQLEAIAAYAFDRRKYIDKTFRFGEGLPGTCAVEKEKIYMNDIPESFSDIISGVGQTRPRHALLVPLKIQDEIFGVIELASFRPLEKYEFEFIDQIADIIASGLQTVRNNERTTALLQQSRDQSQQLTVQEEELQLNLQKLEIAREESLKKESEINGILNAINASTLVAEYSPSGRFTHINDKFLEVLEASADMVLGKHHSEFAGSEKYTDAYKEFWETLKSGTTITKDEKFTLLSGKEVWLRQTYTPVRNKEGKVARILDIAVDITLAKKQQAELDMQASEMKKQHLEMGSLNDAMEKIILRCELDQDAGITSSNRKFESTTGLEGMEFLGRNFRLFLDEQGKEQFEELWNEVLQGKTKEEEMEWSAADGQAVRLRTVFSPVKNRGGDLVKVNFLALDISETKILQQQIETAEREIERLQKELR